MQYPHRHYLLFLVSRRQQPYEIAADCLSKGLIPPNDEDLADIQRELGTIPNCWRGELTRGNTAFYRWLRDRGVLELWRQGPIVQGAVDFLYVNHVRKDFEAIFLTTADAHHAGVELRLKYAERYVPDDKVLEKFVEVFWNLGEMTHQGIFDFLQANQDRQELIPAAHGDIALTYGALGLRQRIEAEALYDEFIALAHQEARRARGLAVKNGAYLAGLSALGRVAGDMAQQRAELHEDGADNSLRQDAHTFRTRMIQADPIPAFDELVFNDDEGDVIDAEFIDAEAGNVRQLPATKSGA